MRCIHLDFHTGPDIKNIGKSFNKEEFTRTVKEANVDLMTVFAKCHHGYMYYPSKVGEIHPGLDFDLLGAEIEAIHEAGAKAPIYISLGFSKKDADEHPEWREINFYTGKPRYSEGPDPYEGDPDPDSPMPETKWAFLCGHGEYGKYLDVITREVCERYDVSDGVFYDICHERTCVCDYCKKAMTERGFDCTKEADVRKYYDIAHVEMMNRLVSIVHEYSPEAPVFFNGGADMNRTCLHPCQSHYEIEDLPTAWGGYDNMPVRAKFFERYGKRFMGMTGKFHHAWGEFGGFKSPEALKYECADMVSVGASISVGDHMHPMGKLDESTYAMIGYAFDYAKKIEKYSEDTKAYTDIALWLTHYGPCDMGASKLLHIMHLEYDIVEAGDDIS